VPEFVQRQLLTLHFLALKQARDFLAPGGAVLSMLGGRVPLDAFHQMAQAAGFRSEIYTYSWKVQADAEPMTRGHAEQQRAGYGPFHFYPIKRLQEVFAGIDLAHSQRAHELEAALAPDRLDATARTPPSFVRENRPHRRRPPFATALSHAFPNAYALYVVRPSWPERH
jgi:hypothetical protein